jgi:DNA-binding transcriptional ArsR family regulator
VATRTPPDTHTLTLGPAVAATRRAVGPIAWVVLEHLASTAELRAGQTVSHESIRRIAAALDLAKDTIARAIRRLADAGLVEFVPSRADDGRFAPSRYRLTLPAELFVDLPTEHRVSNPHRPNRSPLRPNPSTSTQLSLIDPVPNTS